MPFTFTTSDGDVTVADPPDGEYVYNEFHAEEAISHLIELFRNGPRNQAVLGAVGQQLQELEQAIWDLIHGFDIDTAYGAMLDIVGATVGEARQGRTDDDYRAAIRVRMLVNFSDGKIEQLLEIMRGLSPSAVVALTELAPATIVLAFSTLGTTTAQTALAMLRQAKGGGVKLFVGVGPSAVGGVDGAPPGGVIGSVDGSPAGFVIGSVYT